MCQIAKWLSVLALFVLSTTTAVKSLSEKQRRDIYCAAYMAKLTESDTNPTYNAATSCSNDNVPNNYLTIYNLSMDFILQFVGDCKTNSILESCARFVNLLFKNGYLITEAMDYYAWLPDSVKKAKRFDVCPKTTWEDLKRNKKFDLKSCTKECSIDSNPSFVTTYAEWAVKQRVETECSCKTVYNINLIFIIFAEKKGWQFDNGRNANLLTFYDDICLLPEPEKTWTDSQIDLILSALGDHDYSIGEVTKFFNHPIDVESWGSSDSLPLNMMYLIFRKIGTNIADNSPDAYDFIDSRNIAIKLASLFLEESVIFDLVDNIKTFFNNDYGPLHAFVLELTKKMKEGDAERTVKESRLDLATEDAIEFYSKHWKLNPKQD